MLNFYCRVKALWAARDRGASAVEYALLVVAILVAIGALVFTLGDTVADYFTDADCAITEGCVVGGGGGG